VKNSTHHRRILTTALALALATPAFADPDAQAASDAMSLAVTGYIDASFSHLSGTGAFASGAADRVFDTTANGVTLQQAAVNVGYQPKEGFGAFLNLTAGSDANVIQSFGEHTHNFDVTQAYVQYATGPLTVIAGKFVTLAGAEVIASPTNPNFSRSILFGYAIPFAHTGLRATYAASDTVSVILGVNNGWDDLKDTNSAKTIELGTTYAPSKAFTLAASGYFGRERIGGLVDTGPEGTRSLVDVVATWNMTDALTLIVNLDWGQQKGITDGMLPATDASWSGIAAYANYTFSDQWKASLRAEYFDDKDGYRTGVAQAWKEVTATLAFLPTKAIEVRAELRADSSNQSAFVRDVSYQVLTAQHQDSIGLQALYKF